MQGKLALCACNHRFLTVTDDNKVIATAEQAKESEMLTVSSAMSQEAILLTSLLSLLTSPCPSSLSSCPSSLSSCPSSLSSCPFPPHFPCPSSLPPAPPHFPLPLLTSLLTFSIALSTLHTLLSRVWQMRCDNPVQKKRKAGEEEDVADVSSYEVNTV